MGSSERRKGATGEREWAKWIRDNLHLPAHRGRQYSGGADSPDVAGGVPGTHCEVKRVERLSIHAAMDQAVADTGVGEVPYVAHRRNRTPWLVTVRAADLERFCRRVTESLEKDCSERAR